ncbi:hypothetical protein CN1A_75 [Clavibacter phage CN1A]|uniref:Uncharacterized protein n=1 Tax=Clavibacter phage CN1A TaxID=1406793 RepID=U5PTH5_9CAUD|nr:hypothetical protein CN1A_75 [Clavibacter phage CN1A]AGY47184.1 hypothetical protein CN1A_75 [Clavibacter phage CN1A]
MGYKKKYQKLRALIEQEIVIRTYMHADIVRGYTYDPARQVVADVALLRSYLKTAESA